MGELHPTTIDVLRSMRTAAAWNGVKATTEQKFQRVIRLQRRLRAWEEAGFPDLPTEADDG